MNIQEVSLNEQNGSSKKVNKINYEYIENFKWDFRVWSIAFIKNNNEQHDVIEIDPGGGCMESRDIERWKHIGFGFYKNIRKNITFWLDKESDFTAFRVRSFLK